MAVVVDELNRPGRGPFPLDARLLFDPLQMTHHPVGRADVEGDADFAYGGAIAPTLNFVANELVNLSLAVRELAEVRHRSLPSMKVQDHSCAGNPVKSGTSQASI